VTGHWRVGLVLSVARFQLVGTETEAFVKPLASQVDADPNLYCQWYPWVAGQELNALLNQLYRNARYA
jgi:hypothetical protein